MKKSRSIIFVVLAVLGGVVLFSVFKESNFKKESEYIEINNGLLKVELAETKEEKLTGLSEKKNLAPDKGMLFIYEETGYPSIWMKDMDFWIDIIWLSTDKKIVDYKKDVSPLTYPKSFKPEKPAKYVLETKAGFVEENKLEIGSKLNFTIKK